MIKFGDCDAFQKARRIVPELRAWIHGAEILSEESPPGELATLGNLGKPERMHFPETAGGLL
jgi:hypothetical protein